MVKFLNIGFLCFLLFSFHANGQVVGGLAFYKVVISKSYVTDKVPERFRADLLATDAAVSDLIVKLSFNTQSAIFELVNKKEVYSYIGFAAGSYCDCREPKYYDLVAKKSMIFNWEDSFMKEKEYIIERPLDIGWKIEKESKRIGQYTCYKATATAMDNDGRVFPVEAWFCPEIPFAFGPRGFGGLPGLILELRYDRSVIGLESLQLTDKVIDITMPNQGKRISLLDFIDFYKKEIEKQNKE